MNKKLKTKALLKHRLILQAAMCVEDLLLATEKDGGRPWIAIVYDHMESLFRDKEKEKYKQSKKKSLRGNPGSGHAPCCGPSPQD